VVACSVVVFVFFFSSRRRHTRCYRDWSSDVCSSDLLRAYDAVQLAAALQIRARWSKQRKAGFTFVSADGALNAAAAAEGLIVERSEERRVGKECRCRGAPCQ